MLDSATTPRRSLEVVQAAAIAFLCASGRRQLGRGHTGHTDASGVVSIANCGSLIRHHLASLAFLFRYSDGLVM